MGSGKNVEVFFMALESAKKGQLLDSITTFGRFEEPVARYFFRQLINGLSSMHKNDIAHRDLKAANILLGEDLVLKISGFGIAGPTEDKNSRGLLATRQSTGQFTAPEMYYNKQHEHKACDLFASAIILFIMLAAHPPFTAAQPSDPFYKCFIQNPETFWKTHSKTKPTGQAFFSE